MLNLFFVIYFAYMITVNAGCSPLSTLDLPLYMGRWYQVYKDKFDKTFQGDGTCAVADYGLLSSNVTVLNSQLDKDGTVNQIAGYAFYNEGYSGGELTVLLDGVSRPAPYWVIEIGPVVNDQYDYSIVTDNNQISLFVLSRNVSRYYDLYDKYVQQHLFDYGFTNVFNTPITMDQTNCNYDLYAV